MKVFLQILILIFNVLKYIENKRCGADLLKVNSVFAMPEGESHRNLKETPWKPIRLHFDYHYIENLIDVEGGFVANKTDYIDLKEKIMPKTKAVIESLITVKRIKNKLRFNATKCGSYSLPPEYQIDGEGVDADLVIFPMIDETGEYTKQKIEAAASYCIQHSTTRRPLAGYIVFKPNIGINNQTTLDYNVWLVLHEVSHLLGFSSDLFQHFMGEDEKPLGIHNVIDKVTNQEGHTMGVVKTPNVLKYAREHFKCDNLTGVPLEYHGGAGTEGSHWSKRYMNTDYMIGESYGENLISNITLAFFEDTGWYKPNYQMSNLFTFGQDVGCGFFNETCLKKAEIDSKSGKVTILTDYKKEICTKANQPLCSYDHVFRAVCSIHRHKHDLPEVSRYFGDLKIGGHDEFSDYCPIPIEYKQHQHTYGGSCREGSILSVEEYEKVCPECACFLSSLRKPNEMRRLHGGINLATTSHTFLRRDAIADDPLFKERSEYRAGCYEFKCREGSLKVVVGGKQYDCNDESIRIPGYEGEIRCPDKKILCHPKYTCKFGCEERYSNSNPFRIFTYNK